MLNIKKESEHLYINIGKLTLKIGLYRLFHLKKRSIVILEQGGFGDYICCRHFYDRNISNVIGRYCHLIFRKAENILRIFPIPIWRRFTVS